MGSWAEPVDYRRVERRLLAELRRARTLKLRAALSVLLIQLRNGARLGEAMDAWDAFVETGEREVHVRVRKSRRTRLVVIPPEVERVHVRVSRSYVKQVCRRYLGVNTHTLRYAYVTQLSRMGVPFHVIAKITRHADPRFVEHYVQDILARELQLRFARRGAQP